MPHRSAQRAINLSRLTASYYLSVLTVLVVALLSAYLLERSLAPQTSSASETAYSGRKRMLVERLAKTVILLSDPTQPLAARQKWMAELGPTFGAWSLQISAEYPGDDIGAESVSDPELARALQELVQPKQQIHDAIAPVLARWESDGVIDEPGIARAREVILAEEPVVLRLLERIVGRRESLGNQRLATTSMLVQVLTGGMVFVLFLQLFFVMRPVIGKVREQFVEQERLVRDLERKTAELREREQEAHKLALVASRTGNAVIITNAAGEVEWINEACTRITGYTFEEMRGHKPGALLQCDKTDPATAERMRQHIARREAFSLEILNRNKSGRDYWLLIECQPIFDEMGELRNFIAVQSDLTERVEAQEELQRLLGLQRTLLDNAPYGIIATNREGIITVFNPAAERMFGYRASQVIGEEEPTILLDETELETRARQLGAEFNVTLDSAFDALVIRNHHRMRNQFDWTFVRANKERFPGRLNIAEMRTSSGTIVGYIAIASDISEERKVAEELMSAKEQAEAGARSKADFLANMSHEIRTPLNAVIGMTGLLLETRLSPEQREYASTVRTSGEALLALINDILDFSKIDAGRLDFECVPFSVRRCVEEVGDLVAQTAHGKGLEFAILVHHDVPEYLEGDPTRLRQVLLNLTHNAVKFTQAGEVTIEVRPLESADPARPRLAFSVSDTGIGIAADKLPLLFQSFSQADTSTTRRFGGTGLGLAISRRLVEMMGGGIHVTSAAGKGSSFHFELEFPLAESPVDMGEPTYSPLECCHVLVVDDNETNRRVLREQLRSWNCTCDEVADSTQALDQLRNAPGKYKLALIDFQMPGTNGEDLARLIRLQPELSAVHLIMLTSSPRSGDTRRMREAGFDAFLTKPIKQSHLYEAMRLVLSANGKVADTASSPALLLTEESLAELRRSGIRILLVEDNLVNQKVAVRILERAGLRCDVAGNGIEAVEAVQRIAYDLVLMDCQMPEMDGYEATGRIRTLPPPTCRVPIVAMTAEALKGDRERCIAAGMDDYLTKPIDSPLLYRMVERYLPREQAHPPRSERPPLDLPALRDSLGGSDEVVAEVLRRFLRTEAELSAMLRDSLMSGTNAAVAGMAHALAAAAQSVRADLLAKVAGELEEHSRQGRLMGTPDLISRVIAEGQAIRQQLDPILAGAPQH